MDVRRVRRGSAVLATAVLAAGLTAPEAGGAYPRPGQTERVSVSTAGDVGDRWSGQPSISADGRFVAFVSHATNLVPGDTNQQPDVFVRDREAGTMERVSVASDDAQADDWSWDPVMTPDGSYVAFASAAHNLIADDTNFADDVFLHDRTVASTERISVSSEGEEADNHTGGPVLTPDGRFVLFHGIATNLVPGDTNDATDVFLRDRQAGTTARVSVASDGTQGDAPSFARGISPDGRLVLFSSRAANLVPDDTGAGEDLYLHDRQAGTTELISMAFDGGPADGETSFAAEITPDGRYVAFTSWASNLVPSDTNGLRDVFVHDRQTGRTERVSVTSAGGQAQGDSLFSGMSPDGRFIAFTSWAGNIVPGDTNQMADAFVHDRWTGATERVSISSAGTQGNQISSSPAITPDGRLVAFSSRASNLAPGGGPITVESGHIYLRDRGPALGIGELTASVDTAGTVAVTGWATFSGGSVSEAATPAGDVPDAAADAGADLVGARLLYQAEDQQLQARLLLDSLPATRLPRPDCPLPPFLDCPGVADPPTGAPGLVYGLDFSLDGTDYQLRALPVGVSAEPPSAPLFALYRCATVCTEVSRAPGGMGATGPEVVVALPDTVLDSAGKTLTGLRAFTAVGEAAPGPLHVIDEVALPDAEVPSPAVALGVAPAGTAESEVDFTPGATLTDGVFAGTVATPGPGKHDVWARACLAQACGTAVTRVEVGS